MNRFLSTCVAALCLGAATVTASAQTGEAILPDVVVTATRVPTAIERLPARVEVIERRQIEERGYRTVQEALRTVPGMTVVPTGGVGAQTSVFTRGTESDHTLVLLDGMPINDPSTATGQFNFGDDLLRDLQRIEVVRGPAAGLYGSSAIGGVVNLITQRGGKKPFEPYGEIAAGNRRTFEGLAGVRGTVGRFDYGASLQGLTTTGFNATPKRLTTDLGERDRADIWTGTASGSVAVTDKVRLSGLVRYRENDFELDNVASDDPNYKGRSEQLTWKTGAEALLLNDRLTTTVDVGQNRIDRKFRDRPDVNNFTTGDDRFESVRSFARFENRLSLPDAGALKNPAVVAGAEYLRDSIEVDSRSDSGFGPFIQTADAKADSLGLYLSGQGTLFDRLTLTLGLRHELPDDFDETTTYRVGGVLDLREIKSRLLASAGTSFKAPTLFDRFGSNNFGIRGNPNLKPERGQSWEIGFDTSLPVFGRENAVSFGATYFHTRLRNLIQTDFAARTLVNTGRAEIDGVESFLSVKPAAWFGATVTYTYTDARNRETDELLLRRPFHQISATAAIRPIPTVSIMPEVVYVGRRDDVRYDDAGTFLGAGEVKGYTLVNLAANYDVTEQVTAFVRVHNLLDKEYEPANGFAGPGFHALGGVRVQF